MNRKSLLVLVTLLVLLLVSGLSVLGASGQAQPAAASSAPAEVRFRYFAWPNHAKVAQKLAADFTAANAPATKLIWDGFAGTSDDERAKYVTMLMAKASDIDILICDSPWLSEFASKGWLMPAKEGIPNIEQLSRQYFTFANSIASYNGVPYGIALSTDVSFLFYRTDLFAKQGLAAPTTMTSLKEAAEKLTAPPDMYGLLFQGAQYEGVVCAWIELFHNLGGSIFGESQENPTGGTIGKRVCTLDGQPAIQATQMLYDLVKTWKVSPPGTVTYTEGEVRKFFEAGGAAMAREWADMVLEFNDASLSKVAGKVGVATLPAGPAGSHTCIGGWVFAVNKYTKHPKEAWAALQYLTSVEGLKPAMLMAGMIPSRPDVLVDPDIRSHKSWGPVIPTVLQTVQNGIPRPLSPIWPQQSDKLQQAIHKVFVGELTADAAMKWAQDEIQKIENSGK